MSVITHWWPLVVRWKRWSGYAVLGLLLSGVLLASCANPIGGGPSVTPTPSSLALAKLKWCSQPFIVFRDEHASGTATPGSTPSATPATNATATSTTTPQGTPTPATLTDWSQIKPLLGFTIYLPAALPTGTCLVSVSGTLHDPVFGGSFTIGYLLPNHTALSLSEAPQSSTSLSFQCTQGNGTTQQSIKAGTATPTASPAAAETSYMVCSGVKGSTNVVFSAQGSMPYLTGFYNGLQPNVDWLPSK